MVCMEWLLSIEGRLGGLSKSRSSFTSSDEPGREPVSESPDRSGAREEEKKAVVKGEKQKAIHCFTHERNAPKSDSPMPGDTTLS